MKILKQSVYELFVTLTKDKRNGNKTPIFFLEVAKSRMLMHQWVFSHLPRLCLLDFQVPPSSHKNSSSPHQTHKKFSLFLFFFFITHATQLLRAFLHGIWFKLSRATIPFKPFPTYDSNHVSFAKLDSNSTITPAHHVSPQQHYFSSFSRLHHECAYLCDGGSFLQHHHPLVWRVFPSRLC